MARINNLTNFLNDVATAIKAKLGDNTPIPASQFDTKIGEIETVGTYQSKTINVTANGSQTITPDTGYDALSSVVINVQVPVKQLQSKTYNFTENTHIVLSPEQGYDGFSSIDLTVNVPGTIINNQDKTVNPSTSQQIISADSGYTGLGNVTIQPVTNTIDNNITAGNIKKDVPILGITGTYEPEINNQNKNITVNGTYTADSGYTGLGTVVVNVPGAGQVPVKLFSTIQDMNNDQNPQENDLALVYRTTVDNCTSTSVFDTVTFPNEVVLSEALENDVYGSFRVVSTDTWCDSGIGISTSEAGWHVYGDTGEGDWFEFNARYSSQDGLTYTLTEIRDRDGTISGNTVSWGIPITYSSNQWNPIIGQFIKCQTSTFDGLYKYTLDYTNKDYMCNRPSNNLIVSGTENSGGTGIDITVQVNENIDVSTLNHANIHTVWSLLHDIYDTEELDLHEFSMVQTSSTTVKVIIGRSARYLLYDMSGTFIGISTSSGDSEYTPNTYRCFSLDLSNNTYTELSSITEAKLAYYNTNNNVKYYYYGIAANDISNILPICGYFRSEEVDIYTCNGTTCVDTNEVLSSGEYYNFRFPCYYISDAYIYAPNQLSNIKKSQLVENVTVFGNNGIVTGDGSIYNFTDLKATKLKEMLLTTIPTMTSDNKIDKWGYQNLSLTNNKIQKIYYNPNNNPNGMNSLLGVDAPQSLQYDTKYFDTQLTVNTNTGEIIYYGIDGSTSENSVYKIGVINPNTLDIVERGVFSGYYRSINVLATSIDNGFYLDMTNNRLYCAQTLYGTYTSWKLSYMDLTTGNVTDCYTSTRSSNTKYYNIIGVDHVANRVYYLTSIYSNNTYTTEIIYTPLDSGVVTTVATFNHRYVFAWMDNNNIVYGTAQSSVENKLYVCPIGSTTFTEQSNTIISNYSVGTFKPVILNNRYISISGVIDTTSYTRVISTSIPRYVKSVSSEQEIDGNTHTIVTYYDLTYNTYTLDYFDMTISTSNKFSTNIGFNNSAYSALFITYDGYFYKPVLRYNNALQIFTMVPVSVTDGGNSEVDGPLVMYNGSDYNIFLNDYECRTLKPISSGGPISQEDYDAAMAYLDAIGV